MVNDGWRDYRSEWAVLIAISKLFAISPEMLRASVRKSQVNIGSRLGITSDERARLKQLERENMDLRRANGI
jgi:transposase